MMVIRQKGEPHSPGTVKLCEGLLTALACRGQRLSWWEGWAHWRDELVLSVRAPLLWRPLLLLLLLRDQFTLGGGWIGFPETSTTAITAPVVLETEPRLGPGDGPLLRT